MAARGKVLSLQSEVVMKLATRADPTALVKGMVGSLIRKVQSQDT